MGRKRDKEESNMAVFSFVIILRAEGFWAEKCHHYICIYVCLKGSLWLLCELIEKRSQLMWVHRRLLQLSQERGDGSLDWNGGSQDGEKPNT